VVRLLGLDGPWHLALDRTQWRLGARDVNVLMLAVVTRRARVPLIWSVLDNRGGTSDSAERIALMRRYLALFGAASVRMLLADREFVGRAWMSFLNENNIPFAIRMKEKLVVTTEDGRRLALGSLLRRCRGVRTFRAALDHDDACHATRAPLWLSFAARRLDDGTLPIVASNTPARAALAAYRSAGPSNASSATPRPAAPISRTPASSCPESSTCSSASSPSRSPGPRAPPRSSSDARLRRARRTDTSPSPASASASTNSEGSCVMTQTPP
jgi:hypothetical protein